MMRLKHWLAAALLLPAIAGAEARFEIDPAHSSAQFSVKHMMITNVRGEFSKVTGSAVWDARNLAASHLEAIIDTSTVNTGEAKRDDHLRSADFLDAAKHPVMTFKSKEFLRAGGGLRIKGDLTLHGVTREIVLDVDGPSPEVKDPWGSTRIGATATTTISRKDFGLTWNKALETGGVLVGDEVRITLDVQLVRKDS
ncbi:MAG: YceI family protein [Bryobacterales bacterium]|nr:YceI family protein [Bryobacterales bacterium]